MYVSIFRHYIYMYIYIHTALFHSGPDFELGPFCEQRIEMGFLAHVLSKAEKLWLPGPVGLVATPLFPLARALHGKRFPALADCTWYTAVLASVRKVLCVWAKRFKTSGCS